MANILIHNINYTHHKKWYIFFDKYVSVDLTEHQFCFTTHIIIFTELRICIFNNSNNMFSV